jgi:hypothetical protein
VKIIGKSTTDRFIVEATEYELANIAGYDYPSQAKEKRAVNFEVGSDVKVSALWQALSVSRKRHAQIAAIAKDMRAAADQVDSINATLATPILEVQT